MRKVLFAVAGVALMATSAMAQTVTSTQKAAEPDTLYSNMYSMIDLRSYQLRKYDGDKLVGQPKWMESRFTLGTKAFDKKLDMMIIPRFGKNDHETHVTVLAPLLYVEYTALESAFGTFAVMGDGAGMGPDNSYNYMFIGPKYYTPNYEVSTAIGTVKANAFAEASVEVTSRKNTTSVIDQDRDAFRLATNGSETVDQEENAGRIVVYPNVTLDLNAIKGLYIGAAIEYDRYFTPTYEYDANAADKASFKGYTDNTYTETSGRIGYKVSDKLTISNTLYARSKGFYEASFNSDSGSRFTNRAMLNYIIK